MADQRHLLLVTELPSDTESKVPDVLTETFCVVVGETVVVELYTVILLPLSDPFTAGVLFTTRIRYPVPVVVPVGNVAVIGEVPVPIAVGVVKLPLASESWAVKVPEKLPEEVYATETLSPAQ